jgi:hypothetical protein
MTQGRDGGDVARVGVEEAWRGVESGRALLVCAYDDARCARVPLQGAIPVSALERRTATLPKDQAIVFYCA